MYKNITYAELPNQISRCNQPLPYRTSFEEFETLHPWSGLNLEMGSETTLRLGVVVQRWEKNYDDNMVQNSAANETVNSNTANQSV